MILCATAVARPNIALVKYWGKADRAGNLPVTGSLSMTLDGFATRTTVTRCPELATDEMALDGLPASPLVLARTMDFVDLVRVSAQADDRVRIVLLSVGICGFGIGPQSSLRVAHGPLDGRRARSARFG